MTGVPGNTEYQVEYSVQYKKSAEEQEWSVSRIFGKLFNLSKGEFELATTTIYSGINPVDNMYIEIDPSDLDPGIYQLKLTVKDMLANKTTQKHTEFYLIE